MLTRVQIGDIEDGGRIQGSGGALCFKHQVHATVVHHSEVNRLHAPFSVVLGTHGAQSEISFGG